MVRRRNWKARSRCPISKALELIGDRWTAVILRDLVNGKKRYSEFLASPEQISTNVLADRLAEMERTGLITSKPYQRRPVRLEYALTEKGFGLLPVLQELCRWGNSFLPDTCAPPDSFMQRTVR